MKSILPPLDRGGNTPLYIQLYAYIKEAVTARRLAPGEKLPSLRFLARELSVSITTVVQAYSQLAVEGYIESRPQSGYYVSDAVLSESKGANLAAYKGLEDTVLVTTEEATSSPLSLEQPPCARGDIDSFSMWDSDSPFMTEPLHLAAASNPSAPPAASAPMLYDPTGFNFVKWKKCVAEVYNTMPEQLLFESEPRGEAPLRREIARYVYEARGVRCRPDQVFIAAGTQQITTHLCRLLGEYGISNVATESPGYEPVRRIFSDRGFAISPIPVKADGIAIEKLPANLPAACYVNPSNQFPTGAVMPIGRRRELLAWAAQNGSYIIEDDYDSELRYFGNPIPAMQGLDQAGRVIYLGSFSSTLFPAAKISYMILPDAMATDYYTTLIEYSQSCSKAEQLALALFMQKGYYRKGIAKLRRLYSAKLAAANKTFGEHQGLRVINTNSGINLLLEIVESEILPDKKSSPLAAPFVAAARELGIGAFAIPREDVAMVGIYYTRIPLEDIPYLLTRLCRAWGL